MKETEMTPEEAFERWAAEIKSLRMTDQQKLIAKAIWNAAFDLGHHQGMTRAAEIVEDIKIHGKGGAPTCHEAILTERDKEEK